MNQTEKLWGVNVLSYYWRGIQEMKNYNYRNVKRRSEYLKKKKKRKKIIISHMYV